MKYSIGERVWYTNEKGQKVSTYINSIDKSGQLYTLDFNNIEVSEQSLAINGSSNFFIDIKSMEDDEIAVSIRRSHLLSLMNNIDYCF